MKQAEPIFTVPHVITFVFDSFWTQVKGEIFFLGPLYGYSRSHYTSTPFYDI